MANNCIMCNGCIYNVPKTRGGEGRICNGLTQIKYGRCPEWRITELIKQGKPSNTITVINKEVK